MLHKDVLGRQHAGKTAALQRSLEQRPVKWNMQKAHLDFAAL
jgi:hypothetical protein